MVQTFTLRGIDLVSPKSLGRYAKDFGEVRQRLWLILRKSFAVQMLYHAAPYFVPSGIILCTMWRGAINRVAPQQKRIRPERSNPFLLWIYMFYFSNPCRRIDSTSLRQLSSGYRLKLNFGDSSTYSFPSSSFSNPTMQR